MGHAGKQLSLTACFALATVSFAGEGKGVAGFTKALEQSKTSGKPLLMVAGADWCPPCKAMEKNMKEDSAAKAAAANFIYYHIDVDHDKEGWSAWTKKYNKPGNGIPTIYIIKPNGEMAHSQCGMNTTAKALVDFLNKYKGLAAAGVAALTPKQVNLIKAAGKEAEALLEQGKFVSAYELLAEHAEFLKPENKSLTKVLATVKKIDDAAIEKIAAAKEQVQNALSEGKKLDGAYQLTTIAGNMADREKVAEKAEAAVDALKKDDKNSDIFKQAALLYEAREAAREEDTAKAKKLYEKLVADFKNSEAAKRAKAKLDELAGGS